MTDQTTNLESDPEVLASQRTAAALGLLTAQQNDIFAALQVLREVNILADATALRTWCQTHPLQQTQDTDTVLQDCGIAIPNRKNEARALRTFTKAFIFHMAALQAHQRGETDLFYRLYTEAATALGHASTAYWYASDEATKQQAAHRVKREKRQPYTQERDKKALDAWNNPQRFGHRTWPSIVIFADTYGGPEGLSYSTIYRILKKHGAGQKTPKQD